MDQVLVERYKEKYGPKCQSITIWTIKDVEKRNCAKEHNLNFKEVWSLKEGKEFIDNLYEKKERFLTESLFNLLICFILLLLEQTEVR